jgi:hypothetical protein
MPLYWLRAKLDVGYDAYDSFVVSAKNEKEAREMCQLEGADEIGWREPKIPFWTDPKMSACKEISSKTPHGIIVGSFNAG